MQLAKSTTVIVTSFLFVSTAAFAQQAADEAQKTAIEAKFNELDANHDSFIGKDEAAKMRGLPERFAASDVNKDGKLDKSEFTKAMGG